MANYILNVFLPDFPRLQVLSVGGNLLTEVPDSVGNLQQLQALTLCDNLIEILPASIARLSNLKSLLIHKNRLRHLPRDIITLKNLVEVSPFPAQNNSDLYSNVALLIKCFYFWHSPVQLSLRENPLVVRFVQEISLHPPTLLELAARVVRTANVPYGANDLPKTMHDYLSTAHCCVNPKCKGDNHIVPHNFPLSLSLQLMEHSNGRNTLFIS